MQGIKRKIVYVALYEAMAIALSTGLMMLATEAGAGHAGTLSMVSSAIAILWNLAFNTAFEAWEARQAIRGRSIGRRVAHAIGFEMGLTVIFVPLFAWWLGIGWVAAFALDAGLLLFFLVYTFVFNLGFDRLFGLPASAMPAA